MKKKVISLAAILVLASMMLVMLSGCITYKEKRTSIVYSEAGNGVSYSVKVTLSQAYDTEYETYSVGGKEEFKVKVKGTWGVLAMIVGGDALNDDEFEIKCSGNELKDGITVEGVWGIKNLQFRGKNGAAISNSKTDGITGVVECRAYVKPDSSVDKWHWTDWRTMAK